MLAISLPDCPELKTIRDIRNKAIGHPMNKGNHKSYHFISRATISKQGFTMMNHDNRTGRDTFVDINLIEILESQRSNIQKQLAEICESMKEMENDHKNEFKNEKLLEIFHPSTDYLFQKIYESFHNDSRIPQATSHIPMIQEMVSEFQAKL